MKRIKLESIKSMLLLLLIALCLIQVGILWYYQNHRFPISFLSSLYTILNQDSPPDISRLKEEVILPTRIIVSDEYTISRWVLNSEDKYFRELGIEAYTYIQTVLSDDFKQQPEKLPAEKWSEISKPFIFEFGSSMNKEVIKFLSNIRKIEAPNAPDGMYKLVIAPWTDQNERNTLYFLYGDVLYKYTLPFIKNRYDRGSYEKIIISLLKDKSLVRYNLYGDIDPKNALGYPLKSDIAIVVKEPDRITVPKIESFIPNCVTLKYNENESPDPSTIAKTLLGSDLKNFDPPETDANGTVTLRNANNIYKQYKNGLMEYTYWSQVPEENRGPLMAALEKAFAFIAQKQEQINKNPNYRLVLSHMGATSDGRHYVFRFNYMVNGLPVAIVEPEDETGDGAKSGSDEKNKEDKGKAGSGSKKEEFDSGNSLEIQDAVTIHVNAQGVVSCRWYVRNFRLDEDAESKMHDNENVLNGNNGSSTNQRNNSAKNVLETYDISFDKFLETYKAKYSELKGSKDAYITDIHTLYVTAATAAGDSSLVPVWMIEMTDNAGEKFYRLIEIPAWEGD